MTAPPSLWFVVPAHGRLPLTEVCLRQLRRTCDTLTENGLHAYAVVVADDGNLDVADDLGFATVRRANRPLGRKWNDGYELAGRCGADYLVPFGSDDWIDPDFVLSGVLPASGQIRCARMSAVVNADATRIARLRISYDGGDGVRIIPAAMLEPLRFRPADEDRERAIDTSVLERVTRLVGPPRIVYHDLHPLQIVDWKSESGQLNPYDGCLKFGDGREDDPFDVLADVFPADALDEMRSLHQAVAA